MSLITWLCTLFQLDVDPRFAGWLQCPLPGPGPLRHLSLELKGIDQSLRLRQLKVLGVMEEEDGTLEVRRSASQIQQDNCEGETLKVFRILTSQVSWSPSYASHSTSYPDLLFMTDLNFEKIIFLLGFYIYHK